MLSLSIYLIFDVAPQVSSFYEMSGWSDWITTCHHRLSARYVGEPLVNAL